VQEENMNGTPDADDTPNAIQQWKQEVLLIAILFGH